jgi:aminoglycoside phosphotransferase (APT) family kinase protein
MEMRDAIDRPVEARAADAPDLDRLRAYLLEALPGLDETCTILQYPGGFSNLTFLLTCGTRQWVMRMPPRGADIKSAHDMGREARVLRLLKPVYPRVPSVILYCDDPEVIGRPFYLMEKMEGIILRNKVPAGLELDPGRMRAISQAAVDNLADLHRIDIVQSGLAELGKPEGYVQRQVEGWIGRYEKSRTDEVADMDEAARWMRANMPPDNPPAFIHNDYKYDNLVLDPAQPEKIIAVLDWEMATVGDPLMDLGTSLAYWAEETDGAILKPFNLTWLPGNLSRAEVVARYAQRRGIPEPDMLFYFVFGSYKIAVIVQQIYARYRKGLTADPRFAQLNHVVKACAHNAVTAIRLGRIGNLQAESKL